MKLSLKILMGYLDLDSNMENRKKIEKYFKENFFEDFINEKSLFGKRLIDSMDLVLLINFLEEEFNVSIDGNEVNIENFDSVDKIVNLINSKL